jgi:long-chain fatty acid transport protein
MRRITSLLLCAFLCAAPLFTPRRVHASPLFELVGSTFGSGGLNARAGGASAASSYFNPALLPQARQGLELGWFFVNDAINVTLDARSSANDVPLSAVDRFGTDNPSVPTDWLNNGCDPNASQGCVTALPANPRQSQGSSGNFNMYQTIGLVSQIWQERLVLGIYAMVPYGSFTQAHSFFVDEREQFFTNSLHSELYGDRLTPVSLAFGAGSRVLDWLSLGLTFTLGLKNNADAVVYVGNSAKQQETLQLSTKVDVAASVSPHFSILIEPLEALDVSLIVHSPQKMEINTAFSTYLPNGDLQRAERPATHAWMPWTVALGTTYDLAKSDHHRYALAATFTYERWSEYLNRQTERPQKNYEWADTFNGTFGARYVHDEKFTLFVDGTYRPSPVPLQTGRTNYVDNDRFGVSAGVNYDMPIEAWKVAMRFGAQAQLHFLPRRHQSKFDPSSKALSGKKYSQLVADEWPDGTTDISTGEIVAEANGLQTNNPGWPGFASDGKIFAGGLNVSLLY